MIYRIIILIFSINFIMLMGCALENSSFQGQSLALNYQNNTNYNIYNNLTQIYNDSLYSRSERASVYYQKGYDLYKHKYYNESIIAFNMAINISTMHESTYELAWMYKGLAHLEIGKYNKSELDESIRCFEVVINLGSSNALVAWYDKGKALYGLGRLDEAISAYDEVIKINPIYRNAWYNKGNALYKNAELEKALVAYNKSTNIDVNYQNGWYNQANVLYLLQRYNDSITAYDKVIKINQSSVDAWNNKGQAYFMLKDFYNSIQAYNEALNISDKYEEAWTNKGSAFYELRRYNDSIEAYDRAITINERNINAWYGKSNCLQKLNRSAEASIAFAKAGDQVYSSDFKNIIFLLFMVIYISLSAIGYRLSRKFKISTEILAFFANLLGFLAFAWVLSGLYDFKSAILVFIYVLLAIAITLICWMSLGLPMDDLWHRLVKAFTISRKNINSYHMINTRLCILVIIVYLIISSIFQLHLIVSEMLMLRYLEIAIVLILLVNLTTALPYIINMLLSIRIDHDTRNIFLVLQFGYLCMNALLLSSVLWIFGISHSVLSISPIFLGIMILLIVFLFLFPYFSGWQRRKIWQVSFLMMRINWIDELLDVFEFPNPSQYATKLQRLSLRIEDRIRLCGEKEIQNEPHANQLDFLNRIHENIIECANQFGALSDDDERLKFGRAYAELYSQKRKGISDMIEQEKNSKPLLWIGFTFGLTSIAATILALISEFLGPTLKDMVAILAPMSH